MSLCQLADVFEAITVKIDNWQLKLRKLEKPLNPWKTGSLSFVGKALIVYVLGLSKLLYLGRLLSMPAYVLAPVNQFVWGFVWGSGIETVS